MLLQVGQTTLLPDTVTLRDRNQLESSVHENVNMFFYGLRKDKMQTPRLFVNQITIGNLFSGYLFSNPIFALWLISK